VWRVPSSLFESKQRILFLLVHSLIAIFYGEIVDAPKSLFVAVFASIPFSDGVDRVNRAVDCRSSPFEMNKMMYAGR